MEKKIILRSVIEVLGRPKEHVEASLKGYIDKLKADERYGVTSCEFAEIKEQAEQEAWATFAEVEMKVEKIEDITAFCFDYMPSMVEIIEPAEITFKDAEVSGFLNDLQAKLHQVDMVAKQVKMENDHLKRNMAALLKNYLMLLLSKKALSSIQLSSLTGVAEDKLEDYLDQLIDEGRVDLKGDLYSRKEVGTDEQQTS